MKLEFNQAYDHQLRVHVIQWSAKVPRSTTILWENRKKMSIKIRSILIAFTVTLLAIWYFRNQIDFGSLQQLAGFSQAPGVEEHKIGLEQSNLLVTDAKGGPDADPDLAQKISRYLDGKENDGALVGAAFYLTRDPDYLEKLKPLAAKSPVAALILSVTLHSDVERLVYAKLLVAQEPNNSLGHYLAYVAAIKSGEKGEAIDFLTSGNNSVGFDLHDGVQFMSIRELLRNTVDSSENRTDLQRRTAYEIDPIVQPLWTLKGGVCDDGIALLKNEPVDAEKLKLASQLLGISFKISGSTGGDTTMFAREALILERGILRNLPPDLEYGETGISVAARLQELAEDGKKLNQHAMQRENILSTSGTGTVADYWDRFDSLGEAAADKWLFERSGPKQGSGTHGVGGTEDR